MFNLLPKESVIVLSVMLGVVVLSGILKFTYRDLVALFDRPTQSEIVAGEQAIDALESSAEAVDTANLIAAVEPCSRWRGYREACITVTDSWGRAADPRAVAGSLWQTWSSICTRQGVAGSADDCSVRILNAQGAVIGGSTREDPSKMWARH